MGRFGGLPVHHGCRRGCARPKRQPCRPLDFPVPVLDKEAASYSVFVTDGYPTMGQVDYADGSAFRVQYGSGDISGIYGGSLVETRDLEGVAVHFYAYADTSYAIWEQDGFSFSYEYTGDGAAEVQTLIQRFR